MKTKLPAVAVGLLILFLLALPRPAQSQELSRKLKINDYAEIWLPEGWRRAMPSEVGPQAFTLRIKERPVLFLPPQLSSQVHITAKQLNMPRVAAGSVDELIDKAEQSIAGVDLREVEKEAGGQVQNAEVRDVYYDENIQSIGVQMHMQLPTVGGVTAKLSLFFVKGGLLQIGFYAPDDSYSANEALFESIAERITINPDFRYNPIGSKTAAFFTNLSPKAKIGMLVLLLVLGGKLLDVLLALGSKRKAGLHNKRQPKPSISPAASPKTEASFARPKLLMTDPLVQEVLALLKTLPGLQRAELFANGAGDYTLAVKLDDTLPLKEQQQNLALARARITCDRITKIVLHSTVAREGAAGKGLCIFDGQDRKQNGTQNAVGQGVELELDV